MSTQRASATPTALVTGGAGFMGSHLTEALLAAGARVRILDDLSTGRLSNLRAALTNPDCSFEQVDIAAPGGISRFFGGVDYVYHLAALADIIPSIEQPVRYHRANVEGTVAVLQATREAGARKLVYAASSSCYGIPDVFPTPETAPARPMYPYALTKHVAEQYVLHWGQTYGLPVVSLRLFNVYGPRTRTSGTYGAVFGVFLAQRAAGKPLTVVGDGTQTRDFVYVSDVVAAFLKAAEASVRDVSLNVGSGQPQSINRLAELIGGETVHVPKRPGEPDQTFADITRIRRLLQWEPKVSFEQGVRLMLERLGDWKDAPVWDSASIAEATRTWFEYLGTGQRQATAAG